MVYKNHRMLYDSNFRYNRIKGLPELNTPEAIYSEWTNMKEGEIVLGGEATGQIPVDDFATMVTESRSLLEAILSDRETPAEIVRNHVKKVSEQIYNYVMFYYDVPNISHVKQALNNYMLREKLIPLLKALESQSSRVFVSVGQLTVHAERLANSGRSESMYWGLLQSLNNELAKNTADYLVHLKSLFAVIPRDTVIHQLMHGSEPEVKPNPANNVSFIVIIQDVSANLDALYRICTGGQPSEINRIISSLQQQKQNMDHVFAEFSEVDSSVISVYTSMSKTDFGNAFQWSWQWFDHGKAYLTSNIQTACGSFLRFVQMLKPCLESFMALFAELEGLRPPAAVQHITRASNPYR